MSGLSNVEFWLQQRRLPTDQTLVQAIFNRAKAANRVLSEDEIMNIVRQQPN